jgi:hypothetical protein
MRSTKTFLHACASITAAGFILSVAAVDLASAQTALPQISVAAPGNSQDDRCTSFARLHPEYHFARGPGGSPCLFATAPSTFAPETASNHDLELWGLPKRPNFPGDASDLAQYRDRYARWKRLVAALMDPKRHRTATYTCTLDEKDFKGPKNVWRLCGAAAGHFPDGRIIPDKQDGEPANPPANTKKSEYERGASRFSGNLA